MNTVGPQWTKFEYGNMPRAPGVYTWYAELQHRVKMASVPYGYVKGEMYVPIEVYDAVCLWVTSQFNKTMSLDRFLIKMFGSKDLSLNKRQRRRLRKQNKSK